MDEVFRKRFGKAISAAPRGPVTGRLFHRDVPLLQGRFDCGAVGPVRVDQRGDAALLEFRRGRGDSINFENRLVGGQAAGFAIEDEDGDFDARKLVLRRRIKRGNADRVARGVTENFVKALDNFLRLRPLEGHHRIVTEDGLGVVEVQPDEFHVRNLFQRGAEVGLAVRGEEAGHAMLELLRFGGLIRGGGDPGGQAEGGGEVEWIHRV